MHICLSVCLILSTSNVHAEFFSEPRYLRAACDFPFSFPPQRQSQTTITELVGKSLFFQSCFSLLVERKGLVLTVRSFPLSMGKEGLDNCRQMPLAANTYQTPKQKIPLE